jgi:hypothetical protein
MSSNPKASFHPWVTGGFHRIDDSSQVADPTCLASSRLSILSLSILSLSILSLSILSLPILSLSKNAFKNAISQRQRKLLSTLFTFKQQITCMTSSVRYIQD